MRRFASLLAALPLLLGCAPVNSQTPALVEYKRSGGIAGRTDRLVIQNDGTVKLSRRGATAIEVTVAADTLARLRTVLQGIRFDTLRSEYLPAQKGADLFEYEIIHNGRRVRTADTAIPPDLAPLITLLNGILRSAG
jgi:hypothetical protein